MTSKGNMVYTMYSVLLVDAGCNFITKLKFSTFSYTYAIPNMHDFLSTVEHKRKEYFFPYNVSQWGPKQHFHYMDKNTDTLI